MRVIIIYNIYRISVGIRKYDIRDDTNEVTDILLLDLVDHSS